MTSPDPRPTCPHCTAIQTRIDKHCDTPGCPWVECVACPDVFNPNTGAFYSR